MKCPLRPILTHTKIIQATWDEGEVQTGEYSVYIENSFFQECYGEDCAAWDKETKKCRKV